MNCFREFDRSHRNEKQGSQKLLVTLFRTVSALNYSAFVK